MLPHVKNKLVENTEGFELWLDEHQDNTELAETELLIKAQESLHAAQNFLEKLEETEGDAEIVQENTEETTPVTAEETNDEVMEPAESSDEESD